MNDLKVRRECVGFLRKFSENFAPFLDTEEQSFEDYCLEMAQDGEWGGNAELQAMSLGFMVNIVIHQLDKPRWEVSTIRKDVFFFCTFDLLQIVNWPATQKTIHLSYHNGEHYSSVRPRDGNKLPAVSETSAASDFAKKQPENKRAVEVPSNVSPEVALVMAATDCGDVEMVRQTLVENLYDVQASINYILLLQETGDSHSMTRPVSKQNVSIGLFDKDAGRG
jgi:OTU domain-containing protein 3